MNTQINTLYKVGDVVQIVDLDSGHFSSLVSLGDKGRIVSKHNFTYTIQLLTGNGAGHTQKASVKHIDIMVKKKVEYLDRYPI